VKEKLLDVRQSLVKRFGFVTVVAAMLLGSAVIIGSPGASAHEGVPHPVHIHSGTCAALGDVVVPLNDVGGEMMGADGSPVAMESMGASSAIPVDVSVTTVEMALADIVGGEFAINAHESTENIQNHIACGDLGGMVMGGTDLAIGLGQLNDSGYSGVAWLHDNGDGTTAVSVFLTESGAGAEHDMGTPGEEDSAAGGETAVSIEGFAFGDPIEVAVGTTVTWTNNDSAPHTVTQSGGGGFQSGSIDQGGTFSFTFEEAGTFEYFCEFHPNMTGTVTVK
jgi:plastocyanin